MGTTIKLGISTCPNDTFAFHAILTGAIDCRDLDFQIELLDIQQLNRRLFAGDFDVAKASFYAALKLAERTVVLPSGSALGFGNGPLLLAAEEQTQPTETCQTTLCPGQYTTASMLFRLFYPSTTSIQQVVFSEIMPLLKNREADFGVCIHEGRFTWRREGLALVEDLGTRWEKETGSPLPLGGILAARRLPTKTVADVQAVIHDSVMYGLAHRERTLPTMRRYAQELEDDVLLKHVDLYVNEWTVKLGEIGDRALIRLGEKARHAGLLDARLPAIEIFGGS